MTETWTGETFVETVESLVRKGATSLHKRGDGKIMIRLTKLGRESVGPILKDV